jgi:hypothetical protein
VLRLAQQKEREGVGIPGGCARRRQRAGRRQDTWRRRSPSRRRQGRKSKGGESSEKGKVLFKKQREEMNLRGPVNEPSSSEPGT